MNESAERASRLGELRGEEMRTPDEVAAMLRLVALGWGERRVAKALGCSRETVRRYLAAEGWMSYRTPRRVRKLDGLREWLSERFRRHRGNADVVRQDLEREKGLTVSLRTVERAVAGQRQALAAEARATLRFETPPGRQLQIDFGETRSSIGGEWVKLHLFVATLGYSRRVYAGAFRHERQSAWFGGIEAAFRRFGGVPQEVLFDNARALVEDHDAATREVRFNERLHAFARYWGFKPRACAPYRARTKGKDERGVGYVKSNAIAGHSFASWAELEAHLDWWMREIADQRIHGTTGEAPMARFVREEAAALRAIDGRPPFGPVRELMRRVHTDATVDVDTNSYSVPWRLIGETVALTVAGGRISIRHCGSEVASHGEIAGRRQRAMVAAHLEGIAALGRPRFAATEPAPALAEAELLRPLSEYENAAGGDWS
ncbi:MAG: IS21 family transposase [Planctomycetaceae bacterium]|nr:IS21 family transposase [Planctomycetaceae bacterium]